MRLPISLIFLSVIATATNAQQKSAGKNEYFDRLLEFSRPNSHHQLLGQLAGVWSFQDKDRPFVKGQLVRKAMYDGRFYNVEITGGRLQVPVASGFKEDNFQSMLLEGYDNGRGQFVSISINNHIGSDIEMETGSYDSLSQTFTFTWETELIPGDKIKNRRILKPVGPDHYIEEYYEEHDGQFTKTRELDYTRIANP